MVDNGSTDGSVDALAAAGAGGRWCSPGPNLGYGAAANRGAAATGSTYVLVCNPDLVVSPGAVAALAGALDADPDAGIAGPLVRTPDGRRYPSARGSPRWSTPPATPCSGCSARTTGSPALPAGRPRRPRRSRRPRGCVQRGRPVRPVDWVSGACFLARRSAFEEVGGFDEAYFMYAEDVDLCWRARRAGWAVLLRARPPRSPTSGVSTARRPYRMILAHHRSLLRFAGRSTTGWRRLLLPLVAAGHRRPGRPAPGRDPGGPVTGPVRGADGRPCGPATCRVSLRSWPATHREMGGAGGVHRRRADLPRAEAHQLVRQPGSSSASSVSAWSAFSRYELTHQRPPSTGPPTTLPDLVPGPGDRRLRHRRAQPAGQHQPGPRSGSPPTATA